jgi:large exoprotein involved in heme utilization and adhesion
VTNTNIITTQQVIFQNRFINNSNNPMLRLAEFFVNVSEVGQSGNVTFTSTGNLTFKDSRINSDTRGNDPAGTITFTSAGDLTFKNSQITSNTISGGKAGNILINAEKFTLTDQSIISASTTSTIGNGQAGDITLNTPTLIVANGAEIFATTTGSGDGGTITINAANSVNLGIGVQDSSPILSVETSGSGKAGNIIINTPHLTISDTAQITATARTTTNTNSGGGGNIILNASKINLAGVVGVFAETQGEAPAGTLQLNPYQNQTDLDITLFPGSIISASTSASGQGGNLMITALKNINISGEGKLAVETRGSGDAGSISITTENLNITNGVEISAATSGSGKGGNIHIYANTFTANNSAQVITNTSSQFSAAQAGNIIVKVRDNITLDGKSGLFANTGAGARGDRYRSK